MTILNQNALAACRRLGMMAGAGEKFVDPYMIAQCCAVLRRRGERWAAEVLGRDISQRSMVKKSMPYLRAGEEYVLVFADDAETKAEFQQVVGDD